MISFVRKTGALSLAIVAASGRAGLLLLQMLLSLPAVIRRYDLFFEQLYGPRTVSLDLLE